MARNIHGRFKELFDEGIYSVARRRGKTIESVERELAKRTGYSQSTVQHWRRGNVPTEIETVEQLVRYCVEKGRVDREWAGSLLAQARHPNPARLIGELFPDEDLPSPRIFMCYQRNLDPDESLALQVSQALNEQYDVFFDQARSVDPDWIQRVKAELHRSDFFVVFISAESIHSEVVLSELEMAHNLRSKMGRPCILPVRLAYREPFGEPLSTYLDHINWAFWENDEDTSELIEDLDQAISGGNLPIDEQAKTTFIQDSGPQKFPPPAPSAQPLRLEPPESTMFPQSAFYVEREGDQTALESIALQGATITIKGPRQMGKSSLLIRTANAASKAGKQIAFLDFQLLKPSFADADAFFRQFCALLTYEIGVENRVEDYWGLPLTNPARCSAYISRYLLEALDSPLLLAMDETDSIFDTDYRTDFFGMLRAWHNNRALKAFQPVWKRLDLALVTSTEPYFFVDNLNQSPFNVGTVVELEDFTSTQVADLNRRHGLPLNPDQEQQLMALLHGHPYLVRRALYLVASQRISATGLFAQASADRGPFGDHLRSLLFRLHNRENLIQGLRQVIYHNTCEEDQVFFRLRGAGLVRSEGKSVVPRCQLYEDFFREHLND